ncbi:MAG: MFS transporter [Pusillimonas sp.]|nr:MFS transporter [Pusillimonas sp.]
MTFPSVRSGLQYGALGLPLSFLALPLYVYMPSYYANEFGMSLTLLGALLLGVRIIDALTDPVIGQLADDVFQRGRRLTAWVAGVSVVLLWLGFTGLFFPPQTFWGTAQASRQGLLVWAGVALLVTYLSYGVLTIIHQSWAARLGGNDRAQSQWVSWRESFALVGVLVASVLPSVAGMGATSVVLGLTLLIGAIALMFGPAPDRNKLDPQRVIVRRRQLIMQPWRVPAYRGLIAVFLLNGIASAIPATLLLFFVNDRLMAQGWEGLFLFIYFAVAAGSMPVWIACVVRWGLSRAWLAGMALAIAGFAGAAFLGSGDIVAFALICAASGFALGADLALPAALLAKVIRRYEMQPGREGAYFGWWSSAAKLNLALAAGLALPLLEGLGYTPGAQNAAGLFALTIGYAVLPCVLKLLAMGALWIWRMNFDRNGEENERVWNLV